MSGTGDYRIVSVALDPRTVERLTPEAKLECDIAIRDLVEDANSFRLIGSPGGPYQLGLGVEENRLVLNVFLTNGEPHGTAMLSISPYRRIIMQYRRQCDSFAFNSGGAMTPEQLEALDMGRRALHDDGARLLMDRLTGKVEMDLTTSRKLFTLIYNCI
jgi:uncharacterized protein (UPF0262 family)